MKKECVNCRTVYTLNKIIHLLEKQANEINLHLEIQKKNKDRIYYLQFPN